jgi:hypothetical protein
MDMTDIVVIGAVLLGLAVSMFTLAFVFNQAETVLLAESHFNETTESRGAIDHISDITARYDYIFFMSFMGIVLAIMVGSWFLSGNPIFLIVYVILWMIGIVVAVPLSNGWETISTKVVFGATLSSFPITNHIMNLLPIYITVIGFMGLILMFLKPGGGE